MTYFLGIDIGGTKSHALIADQNGRAIGWGHGGPGNHEIIGLDGMRFLLAEIIQQATESANIELSEIAGAGLGIAGYDWPFQRQFLSEVIDSVGLRAPFEFVNDTFITLLAGAPDGWGVAVVAGTSNNCRGWRQDRSEGRVVGHGAWMGEFGGAEELVMKAVHAVAADWTRRGPSTSLSDIFTMLAGTRDLTELVEGLAVGRIKFGAEAAPVVFRAAGEGDAVAQELIRWTGSELGSLALGVIRQLNFDLLEFDLVLGGSFFNGSPVVMQALSETIHPTVPDARIVRLSVPPVVGGVMLAMEQVGMPVGDCREILLQSTEKMLIDR
jgi:N-acetylglucosamine kinase-like BadF-type ATPase